MNKIIYLATFALLPLGLSAQINQNSQINSLYLKFLPSDANPEDLRPSDIPSEQVLKQMGFSDEEIEEAMDFKYAKGKYAKNIGDTIPDNTATVKFYESLGDTLVLDSTSYPKARIYGQDIFRDTLFFNFTTFKFF